jgi:MFS family permease
VLGHLTSAIQLGFISGTLIFALVRIADRFVPSYVFMFSAFAGAIANVAGIYDGNTMATLLILRFTTGFFLAGIYPVGMKIAADYYDKGLGKALGYLVGALVVGTALPHLLRSVGSEVDWKMVLIWISALAMIGGLIIGLLVGNGPFRKHGQGMHLSEVFSPFRIAEFRKAAFGYFGHMWELYAFWAFVPVAITLMHAQQYTYDVSLLAFFVIAIGGLGCVLNGYLSRHITTEKAAIIALAISGICCLFSPIVFQHASHITAAVFLLIWGFTVVADSPMFSTLVALKAPPASRGTALTIVTCIGFAITILSIQLLNWLNERIDPTYVFLFLAPGPVAGLIAMLKRK